MNLANTSSEMPWATSRSKRWCHPSDVFAKLLVRTLLQLEIDKTGAAASVISRVIRKY